MHKTAIAIPLVTDAVAFIAFNSADFISQLSPEKYL